jgi:transcriptional antiterminator RfaH
MERWYVAECHSRAEGEAARHLARQGFRAYLPRYEKTRRHARRVETVAAPLFPGYLFVCLDTAKAGWRAVRSTVGVRRLVSAGDEPLPVPQGVIEDIRARETDAGFVPIAESAPFEPGDSVRITSGPMRDQSGWFERMTDKDRVLVLLSLLGRPVRLTLGVHQVRAAL